MGNILSDGYFCYITDLGLCRPADETDKSKVYGVLPYMAPEVLRRQPYIQASDIYSFGIIAWEMMSGLPPYHDIPHDDFLTKKILDGLRPSLDDAKAPRILKDLIEKCWDADPSKRPAASELIRISTENCWQPVAFSFEERYREMYSSILKNKSSNLPYQTHPQATYTSRLLTELPLLSLSKTQSLEEEISTNQKAEIQVLSENNNN
ncbi:MAG: hypothetical protein MRERC_3c023 [Mycoplasmataceae bacterium RC_NB112A]|nr:MAG: hypothetical protein MRERC_3c023 [Mycoplasmataceae bacterium RC_NB112A]